MSLIKLWKTQYQVCPKIKKTAQPKTQKSLILNVYTDKKALDSLAAPYKKELLAKKNCFESSLNESTLHLWLEDKRTNSDQPGEFVETAVERIKKQLGQAFNKVKPAVVVVNLAKKSTELSQAVGLSLSIASYNFKFSKTPQKSLSFGVHSQSLDANSFEKAWACGQAVNLARFLVDLPGGHLNPKTYAGFVQTLFKEFKSWKVQIHNEAFLKKNKMGLHQAVGRAAEFKSCLVEISNSKQPDCAFVGKGITYDTGGLDLKPSRFMRLMKKDMGGSAALVGAAWAQAFLGLKKNTIYLLALADNAVAGNSFRPGDVLEAHNGLQVEIDNTDAEGRLVLGDALSYASDKKSVKTIIDVATLTGAIKVGLGSKVSGLFSNSYKLAQKLHKVGVDAGEPNWIMPLPYWVEDEEIKSSVADLVNSGPGYGGAIYAAAFLKQFINRESLEWAHLDIFAWTDKPGGVYSRSGGSGQGVMTLVNYISE